MSDALQDSEIGSESAATQREPSWPPPGWVLKDDVARMFGIARDTLKHWYRTGKLRFGKDGGRPGGGRCKIYPIAELERLKAEMEAERGKLPEGFVDRDEAAAMFNLTVSGWKKWRHLPRVPAGRWAKVPGLRSLIKVYPLDALKRLRDELEAEGELRPDEATRAAIKAKLEAEEAAKQPPPGMVRRRRAYEMFGVTEGIWNEWEKKGWVRGTKYGPNYYYDAAELERLLDENGRLQSPYPDPDRPGAYRVPLRGVRMFRREAIVDADALSLLDGRCVYLAPRDDEDAFGSVCLWEPGSSAPIALRRAVLGVTDSEQYVVHINEDVLDCRRENLRIKTPAEVCQGNRKMATRNGRPCTSEFKGVCWEERTGGWVAQINAAGHQKRIGRYRDELAAAEAYDEAAFEAWGEHARLNFPDGIDRWLESIGAVRLPDANPIFPPLGWVEKTEVAQMFGVSTHRIWKWEQRGLLPGGKMALKPGTQGKLKIFPRDVVQRLMNEKRCVKTTPRIDEPRRIAA